MKEEKKTLIIRKANFEDTKNLTDFRISQFRTAKEFELLNSASLSSQLGYIYIVEVKKDIVSTMQIEVCSEQSSLKDICAVNIPSHFADFNTIYLSRAATVSEFRNIGLNSYLRMLIIEKAIKDFGINSLTGFAYENAPRLNLLKELGYEFTEVELISNNYTVPRGKVYFLKLKRENFQMAYEKLLTETNKLKLKFDIIIQSDVK